MKSAVRSKARVPATKRRCSRAGSVWALAEAATASSAAHASHSRQRLRSEREFPTARTALPEDGRFAPESAAR
jgi:hypothetical protein